MKTSKKEILECTVGYCTKLLTNNKPDEEYTKDIDIKNKLHDARMQAQNNDEERFDDEDFQKALKRFAAKNKNCYSFLTKAGKDFQEATKILLQRIWETEDIPKAWEFTLLIMLYKGRGLKEIMDNNRFIHSKDWMPRLFEDLVVDKMKPKVQEKTTKFQIGGMKGHRSTEHLFSVKSVLAYYAMIQQPIILSALTLGNILIKKIKTY